MTRLATGLKLLLQGNVESFGDEGDPFPVALPGGGKAILSTKIGSYLDAEFWHYYQIYINTKHCGPPFSGGWAGWPPWLCQLVCHFDGAVDLARSHNEAAAYKKTEAKRWLT
jgi:hypothetical protein